MTEARRSSRSSAVEATSTSGPESFVFSLRRGDVGAIAEAYDRWHGRVRVLARRLLSDDAAAEDVVQEVFVALPRALRSFREEVPIETFVLAITVKRARQHLRSTIRRRQVLRRLCAEPPPSGPHDPELLAHRSELALRLATALDRLPAAQRIAFVLCQVDERGAADAAAITGVPESTVRTRLFHARRRLRELLRADHE